MSEKGKFKVMTIDRSSMSKMTTEKTLDKKAAKSNAKLSKFSKIPDAIAESDHYVKNEPIPHGDKLFPKEEDWKLRWSDLYYPYAKGGPLFIDIPMNDWELASCKRKQEAYHAAGVRYAYIDSNESAADVQLRLHGVKTKSA